MTVMPVIWRELRAEARRSSTLWLRLFGGAAAMGTLAWVGWEWVGEAGELGQELFTALHTALFVGIWIFGPALAADCLSRERREGTLGLLFLTPLTPEAVVVAKGLVHGLRGFGLLFAAVPVMTMPFLLGGVTWQAAVMSVLINVGVLLVALGAGLLASSRCREWLWALILAEVFGGLAFVGFIVLQASAVIALTFALKPYFALSDLGEEGWRLMGMVPQVGLLYCLNAIEAPTGWKDLPQLMECGGMGTWLLLQAGVLVLHGGLLRLAIRVASRRLARRLADEPPSPRQLWWVRTFCTPQFWKGLLRARLRRALERNPVGWVQQRRWGIRSGMWTWFLLVALAGGLLLPDGLDLLSGRRAASGFFPLVCVLLLAMALGASTGFRAELEAGVLELLVISPLSEREIALGRLRGFWGRFGPAIGLFCLISFLETHECWERPPGLGCVLVGGFLSLPVIGLHAPLRSRVPVMALVQTFGLGLVLPAALGLGLHHITDSGWLFELGLSDDFPYVDIGGRLWIPPRQTGAWSETWIVGLAVLEAQAVIAAWAYWRLLAQLRGRTFAFPRAGA